ncbi:MAG: NAD(P)H-dependent glycerol-3-phosphate dehydrogenase [Melioribacteraceae bacterium]|jgi:glycerol-3-phosphate dehydrogenase (NAD(P)+)|nr:NAD(P)H-dependent glycerol-3-phosphate dehydrogenase [Melioribacteraceae bacterium]
MKVSVLGGGSWGTALAIILANNGHDVALWEFNKKYFKDLKKTYENKVFLPGVKLPREMEITNSLKDASTGKHMIVIATPTQFVRNVLKQMKNISFTDTTFVSVSKGIEKETLLTVNHIISEELGIPEDLIGVLSGPSHAEEVSRKIPTAVVAASTNIDTAIEIQNAFSNSYFRVYSSTDIIGVELGGALKNVIAVGAGIIDGAKFGDNTKAAIMTRGIAEISRLGIELGARPETFSGLSGMGDLIVTCMSRHSRNRHVGEQIGMGKKLPEILKSMTMVAEGVETCKSVHQLAAKHHIDVPIANAVYNILFNGKDPMKVTYDLMSRGMKTELEY